MSEIDRAQGGAEALALIVAQYYQTLHRENIPTDVAQTLTLQYQDSLFRQLAGQHTLQHIGQWIQRHKKPQ